MNFNFFFPKLKVPNVFFMVNKNYTVGSENLLMEGNLIQAIVVLLLLMVYQAALFSTEVRATADKE